MLGRKLLAKRYEVFSRIQTRRDLPDVLAPRLAVTQVGGTGDDIDLRARVVDIVFLRDVVAACLQQNRECVPEHGTAAVSNMQGSGWVH